MWLAKKHKYARFNVKTRINCTAIEKTKVYYRKLKAKELAGITYLSITTKVSIEDYLVQQELEIGPVAGIVAG